MKKISRQLHQFAIGEALAHGLLKDIVIICKLIFSKRGRKIVHARCINHISK